mmetsp:Transcript_6202/g.19090  ORF Transcript_6202/g.19090 Transcript_6202/m.19090 type:complete len:236 (+) Transcript_6202:251-958(+)
MGAHAARGARMRVPFAPRKYSRARQLRRRWCRFGNVPAGIDAAVVRVRAAPRGELSCEPEADEESEVKAEHIDPIETSERVDVGRCSPPPSCTSRTSERASATSPAAGARRSPGLRRSGAGLVAGTLVGSRRPAPSPARSATTSRSLVILDRIGARMPESDSSLPAGDAPLAPPPMRVVAIERSESLRGSEPSADSSSSSSPDDSPSTRAALCCPLESIAIGSGARISRQLHERE